MSTGKCLRRLLEANSLSTCASEQSIKDLQKSSLYVCIFVVVVVVFVISGKLCGRSIKVPYKDITSLNKSCLRVTNMPEGINFKHPSNYGVRTLRQIMSAKDNIVFQFDDRKSSSTIARSTVAPTALGVTTTSTAEITSSATTALHWCLCHSPRLPPHHHQKQFFPLLLTLSLRQLQKQCSLLLLSLSPHQH